MTKTVPEAAALAADTIVRSAGEFGRTAAPAFERFARSMTKLGTSAADATRALEGLAVVLRKLDAEIREARRRERERRSIALAIIVFALGMLLLV